MARTKSKFNRSATPFVWADPALATARAKPALAAWKDALGRLARAVETGERGAADFAAADVTEAAEAVAKILAAPATLYPTAVRPSFAGSPPLLKNLAEDLAGPDGELMYATLTGATPAE